MNHRILLRIAMMVGCFSLLPLGNASSPLPSMVNQSSELYSHEAVAEIFGGPLPKTYQMQRGGVIDYSDKTQGYYLILSDTVSDAVILIADVRVAGRRQGLFLKNGNFKTVASHLLTRYMKSGPSEEINVDLEKLELPSGEQGAAHLTIVDAKGLAQPKLITRLHYGKENNGQDRTVLLLLGLPSADAPKGSKRDFSQTYLTLESEARRLIPYIRPSDRLLPSERYMLWRLRQIFW